MRKTYSLISLLSFLIGYHTTVLAQNSFDEDLPFPKRCYLFTTKGDKVIFTEKKDLFISKVMRKSVDGKADFKLDTAQIVKRLSKNDFIITERKNRYVLLHRKVLVPDSIVGMGGPIEGESMEEIVKIYKTKGLPVHTTLHMYYGFSEAKITELELAPGLNKIKRQDLITALSWRKEIGSILRDFKRTKERPPHFRIKRMIENYRNKKLVDLGYNPFRPVTYNWRMQFENDKEVIRLLNEPIGLDN
ncbi:MAG: hypothetical protein AAGD17_07130 [Bacteroidota bacterium]